jgi:Mrp family chromosome partitioning ATPase
MASILDTPTPNAPSSLAPRTAPPRSEPAPLPGADELFRSVYTRAALGFGSEVVAVCSAIAGEGRTSVSLGLAVTMAQDFPDRRALLVETDLQQPVLAKDFAIDPSPGLAECLLGEEPLEAVCRPSHLGNLDLLPAGGPVEAAGRPVRGARMAVTVDTLRQRYDVVILDTPALLVNSDALVLTDLSDAIIFVVQAGVTPSALVTKALEQLDEAKIRGVVLNNAKSDLPGWLRRLAGL